MFRAPAWPALAFVGACAASTTPPPVPGAVARMLVLPLVEETEGAGGAAGVGDALFAGLVDDGARVDADRASALPEEADCIERASCLRGLGRAAAVDFVVVAQVATLGDTSVLRVRMVAVADDEGEVIRQVVVSPATEAELFAAARTLGRELGQPFRPDLAPSDAGPRRMRIAFPIAAGALALGTGLGVGLRAREPGPDVVVDPP